MMHEEFVSLTKVEVSNRFYTSNIEPEYMSRNDWESKEAFCTYWLKDNRTSIVKANIGDIISLTTDANKYDCAKADAERAIEARKEVETELARETEMLGRVSKQNDEYWGKIEDLQRKNKELRERESELVAELDEAKEAVTAKDAEIQRLKAMLFDAMYSKAA